MKTISSFQNFVFVSLAAIAFWTPAARALEFTLTPSIRSYPTSGSVEAQVREEYLIWDQRQDAKWKFGFVQPRAMIGAHGLAEAGLNFNPVSFLELGAAYSTVSRYYNTRPFDCDAVVCKGILARHRYTARLVGGHEFDSFSLLGMLTYHRIRLSTADASKPLLDESEVLLGAPGSDTVESQSLMLGAQREGCLLGVYVKKARMLESRAENESQYLIIRHKLQDFSVAAGVGRYASDFHDPGFSAVASATWTWGQSISLF
jgi:hypothetical protein